MKIVRGRKLYRTWAEAMESRIVLDAAFPFAVAIGDTMQSGGAGASISPISQVGADSAGDVYVAGNFANLAHFGIGPGEPTNLPQLTYGAGPTLASYFVAATSPIPIAPTGAALTQIEGGSSRTPSFLVSGVAPDTPVTLFNSPGDSSSLPPGTRVDVGSRVGPGVITITDSPSVAGDFVASPYYPIDGAGVVSNTLLVIAPESDPSIFSPLGPPRFKNSDGTLIPAGGVTTDPQPIVFASAGFATSVDLLDGSGNVLVTAQIPGGMMTYSSFQIQLPKGLTGRIQLYLRARDSYGYTSPVTATSTITIATNSGGGGGGGGGGGTGATGPVVNAVTIASQRRGPKVIQIVFSGTVDPAAIEALSHYALTSAGRDRRFGDKDDKALILSRATYNAATHVLTLQTKQALSTAYPLKFTISRLVATGLYTAFLGPKAKRENPAFRPQFLASCVPHYHLCVFPISGFRLAKIDSTCQAAGPDDRQESPSFRCRRR